MTVDELREALGAPEAESRRRAVIALDRAPDDVLQELIFRAMGDEDWRVRKESVRVATAAARRMSLLEGLVDSVTQGENVGLRNAALEVLGNLGERIAAPLVEALSRAPDEGRKFLVQALGRVGGPLVLSTLAATAREADANIAAAAIDALASVGGPEAETTLREQLTAEDPYRRMAALDALDRLEARVPWEELSPLLVDRLVRRVALPALGRSGDARAVAPLLAAMHEPSRHVVAGATGALSRLCSAGPELAASVAEAADTFGEEVRAALRDLLAGGDRSARQAAAHLLSLIRDDACLAGVVRLSADTGLAPPAAAALTAWGVHAVRPLLEVHRALSDSPRAAALELAADLGAAEGASVDPDLASAVRAALRDAASDPHGGVALATALCMGTWAEPEDAAALVSLAQRGDERVAHASAAALAALAERSEGTVAAALEHVALDGVAGAALTRVVAKVGGASALQRLGAALSADDPGTRRAAIDALSELGGRSAADNIGLALADEDVDVQIAAARALGRMRDAEGHPLGSEQLTLALSAGSDAVRAAAARALGASGETSAAEALRDLLRGSSPGVAVAAMEGLRALGEPALGELLMDSLGHEDPEVVKEALSALAEEGGERRASRLALGLDHGAWDVRQLAAELLAQVGGAEAKAALEARKDRETDDLVSAAINDALRKLAGAD